MKALITAHGNTAVVANVDIPEPAAGEIRYVFLMQKERIQFLTKPSSVKVHSVSLNPIDPLYTAHPAAPPGRVVGSDIAGTVEKIGEGVTSWNVGDRAAGFLQGGE